MAGTTRVDPPRPNTAAVGTGLVEPGRSSSAAVDAGRGMGRAAPGTDERGTRRPSGGMGSSDLRQASCRQAHSPLHHPALSPHSAHVGAVCPPHTTPPAGSVGGR
mmetsp:Transcript_35540/g.99360  ORF Transcript_35540/g.99360 Transcript_35540/m.99360 type:complete len:105 (+) Transcript_35540:180-494(+)